MKKYVTGYNALIVANAAVLAGPLLLGWNVRALLLVFWLEVVFAGLVNIAKMGLAEEKGPLGKSRTYQVIFYIAHYSTFCVMYWVVILAIVRGLSASYEGLVWAVLPVASLLGASHVVSLFVDYRAGGECERASSQRLMWQVYVRVAPVQAVVVVAAVVTGAAGVGEPAAVAVWGVKTVADVVAYVLERRRSVG